MDTTTAAEIIISTLLERPDGSTLNYTSHGRDVSYASATGRIQGTFVDYPNATIKVEKLTMGNVKFTVTSIDFDTVEVTIIPANMHLEQILAHAGYAKSAIHADIALNYRTATGR